MRYRKFIIENYRAITGPLEVSVEPRSLVPIIGVNESGKTTILQAVFAFDHHNDSLNQGRHLEDIANLYKTASPAAIISAQIEVSQNDILDMLQLFLEDDEALKSDVRKVKKRAPFPETLLLRRNLTKKKYAIEPSLFDKAELDNQFAQLIVTHCPYILYFDDFRDKIDDEIRIDQKSTGSPTGWLAIMERLFKVTDPNLSVFKLAEMEERQRKSALAKVKRVLNRALTKEWQNFRLDDRDALEISVDFVPDKSGAAPPQHTLKLDVVETDQQGDEHFFFIADRSKGFFWFFNFVMKLEFNPKVLDENARDTIYLLDEPGSYLHASAQAKLCKKLRTLSEKNRVIYCTHSHYLLNPDVIPLASINVADKDPNGSVTLVPIFEYRGSIRERRSAYQPVLDALEVKPFLLDTTNTQMVIVEGIYDYYALELFKEKRRVGILPSVGADSIKYFISVMIAWAVDFRALWDNDEHGRERRDEAARLFGEEIAGERFKLVPRRGRGRRRIIQDLFDGADLARVRSELGLPANTSFEKTMAAWFFSPQKVQILSRMSHNTRSNFDELYVSLDL